jgi:lipase chaperone LimK
MMMKGRGLWIVTGLVAAALVVVFVLVHSRAPPAAGGASSDSSAVTAGASDTAVPSSTTESRQSASAQTASPNATPGASAPEDSKSLPADAKDTMFRTDSSGQLITDEQARLNIEQLVALNDPAELQRKVQEIAQTLPPAAAQRLPDLVERYRNYSVALRQNVPPDQAPASEQDAVTMLETMHALRVQYFGKEAAEGFFAAEEQKQRQLIELMRLQNDQSLTLQERAEKAQAVYQSMPELKSRQDDAKR